MNTEPKMSSLLNRLVPLPIMEAIMLIQLIELKSVDSTNDWAKRHLGDLNKEALSLIIAEEQTAGRGQYNRRWYAPPGQIIASFVFFRDNIDQSCLVQLLALVVQDVLREEGVFAHIKWPNDLLIDGKKVAGILTETADGAYILGLGLNLKLTDKELSAIDQPATSLWTVTGKEFSRNKLLEAIATRLIQKIWY